MTTYNTREPGYAHVTTVIGRNIGEDPMSEKVWNQFQSELVHIVRECIRTVSGVGLESDHKLENTAVGSWNSVGEVSAGTSTTIRYYTQNIPPYTPDYYAPALQELRDLLESSLAWLAHRFEQDAIAFSVTPSELAWTKKV